MLRKIVALWVLFPLIMIGLISMNWSCEKTKYQDMYIKDVHFYGPDFTHSDTTTIANAIYLTVIADGKQECCLFDRMPFISSACAMNLRYTWKNELQLSSFSLSFDKDIRIDNASVSANTNLLTHPIFSKYAAFKKRVDGDVSLNYLLQVDEPLLSMIKLDSATYRATFKCTSTDGKPYNRQLVVMVKK